MPPRYHLPDSELKGLHGQSDHCIGRAAFTVIPLQKSGHSYLLRFVEQRRAIVKEVSLRFIQDLPPPPTVNQSCQCGTIKSHPHCLKIWEAHSDVQLCHSPYGASNHIFGSSINWIFESGWQKRGRQRLLYPPTEVSIPREQDTA